MSTERSILVSGTNPESRTPCRLELIPLGETPAELLDHLAQGIDRRFHTSSLRTAPVPLRREWLGERNTTQYSSNAIVDALAKRFAEEGKARSGDWFLGVVDADLYAPERPFVFGEAMLGGYGGVIGLARLRAFGTDEARFRARALTEAVHELGHVAGLGHCNRPACVMRESADLRELDRKGPDFCSRCAAEAAQRMTGRCS